MSDLEYTDDYMTAYLYNEDRTRRVVLSVDEYGTEPEFDLGCPVLRVESYGWRTHVHDTGYGGASADRDGIEGEAAAILQHFIERHGESDGIDAFNRYLCIFHGGSARPFRSTVHRGGPTYVTYDTRAMRAYWGLTGDDLDRSAPEAGEYKAYIDGEVYWLATEHLIDASGSDFDYLPEWEHDGAEDLGGLYYGARTAETEARYIIDAWSKEVAA